jgi:quercetin dioxygenase-like cupin family protein
MPGKTYLALLLTLPAHGATPPHAHGNTAIMGLMLQGALLNQFNDEKEPIVYRAGEA